MMCLFVRNADDKITTIFQGSSKDDLSASCPTTHRIEDYQEIKNNMMQYAYFRNGEIQYSIDESALDLQLALTQLRAERNRLLAACDWTQAADAPVDRAAWAAYRQALRDLPANTADPRDPQWPSPPA